MASGARAPTGTIQRRVRSGRSHPDHTVSATSNVDDPSTAVADADRLVAVVMEARGYPIGDFEQQAADISVDHPNVVFS